MDKEEKLDKALKYWDFYELAKITYERNNNMNINVNYKPQVEELIHIGNKLFTKEQIRNMGKA